MDEHSIWFKIIILKILVALYIRLGNFPECVKNVFFNKLPEQGFYGPK